MREPILITGAGGFIGSYLADALIRRGKKVRALLLPDEAIPAMWNDEVEIWRGDVTDPASIEAAMAGVGTVFHLAAVVTDWGPESLYQRVTLDGTKTVLRAAAGSGARVVLASSIVVYGHHLGAGPCPEETPHGRTYGPYSRAKQAQEKLAQELAEQQGIELTVVRPANVYGVGSQPWVEMVLPLLRQRQFTLISGGNFDAGLCHVANLVDLLIAAGTKSQAVGRIYNAADGGITWNRYFSDLAQLINAPAPRSVPRALALPLALISEWTWSLLSRSGRPPMTREALNLAGSNFDIPIHRARQELGFTPSISYEDAIEELARHLRDRQQDR